MAQPSPDGIEQLTRLLETAQAQWDARQGRQAELVAVIEQPGQSPEAVVAAAGELQELLHASAHAAQAVRERLDKLSPH